MLLEQVSGEYRAGRRDSGGRGPRRPLPAEGFLAGRLRFYSYPLPFTTGDLEGWLRWARGHHPEHAAEIQTLLDSGARMAVSLRAKGDILGILLLGPPASGGQYSPAKSASCASAPSN